MTTEQQIEFEGPAGWLVGVLKQAPGATAAAVVCHPHPHYGGTLYNKVVYRAARALHAAGMTVLRFNFRGVEGSEGVFDAGRGEVDDARAALDFVGRDHRDLVIAGYSFGAWVGLRAGAADARVRSLVGLAPPVNAVDFGELRALDRPVLLVHGDRDEWCSPERVRAVAAEIPGPVTIELLPGADHAFDGHLEPMMDAISRFVARVGPGAAH